MWPIVSTESVTQSVTDEPGTSVTVSRTQPDVGVDGFGTVPDPNRIDCADYLAHRSAQAHHWTPAGWTCDRCAAEATA